MLTHTHTHHTCTSPHAPPPAAISHTHCTFLPVFSGPLYTPPAPPSPCRTVQAVVDNQETFLKINDKMAGVLNRRAGWARKNPPSPRKKSRRTQRCRVAADKDTRLRKRISHLPYSRLHILRSLPAAHCTLTPPVAAIHLLPQAGGCMPPIPLPTYRNLSGRGTWGGGERRGVRRRGERKKQETASAATTHQHFHTHVYQSFSRPLLPRGCAAVATRRVRSSPHALHARSRMRVHAHVCALRV